MPVPRPIVEKPFEHPTERILAGATWALGWVFFWEQKDIDAGVAPPGTVDGDPIDFSACTLRFQVRVTAKSTGDPIVDIPGTEGITDVTIVGQLWVGLSATETGAKASALPTEPIEGFEPDVDDPENRLGAAHLEVEDPAGVVSRMVEIDNIVLDPELTR